MKIINPVQGETADQRIIRCANNLIKAVLASGRSIHATDGVSGIDVDIYSHIPHTIVVQSVIQQWNVRGHCPIKITFEPVKEVMENLVEDKGEEIQ